MNGMREINLCGPTPYTYILKNWCVDEWDMHSRLFHLRPSVNPYPSYYMSLYWVCIWDWGLPSLTPPVIPVGCMITLISLSQWSNGWVALNRSTHVPICISWKDFGNGYHDIYLCTKVRTKMDKEHSEKDDWPALF